MPCSNENKGIKIECTPVTMNKTHAAQVGCIKGDTGETDESFRCNI